VRWLDRSLMKVESAINVDFVVEDGSGEVLKSSFNWQVIVVTPPVFSYDTCIFWELAAVDKLRGNLFTLRALHIYFGLQKQLAGYFFLLKLQGNTLIQTLMVESSPRGMDQADIRSIPTSNQ
ncbi:hypothetical protein OIU85_017684, partial [Salix viminalis]